MTLTYKQECNLVMLDITDINGKTTSIVVNKLGIALEELAHFQSESRGVATAVTGGT